MSLLYIERSLFSVDDFFVVNTPEAIIENPLTLFSKTAYPVLRSPGSIPITLSFFPLLIELDMPRTQGGKL